MKSKTILATFSIVALFIVPTALLAVEPDAQGSFDHRFFPRYKINYFHGFSTEVVLADYYEFILPDGKKERVEGDFYRAIYFCDIETQPSTQRELWDYFQQLVEGMGGQKLFEGYDEVHGPIETLKFEKEGKEYWVEARVAGDGADYILAVIERPAPPKDENPSKEKKPEGKGKKTGQQGETKKVK